MKRFCLLAAALCALSFSHAVQPLGNEQFERYLRTEVQKLSDDCLSEVKSFDDWNSRRAEYRRQLQEMLGLWPMPERTDLKAVVTGKLEHEEFTVEKLHFQALPQLYVTANLFIPKNLTKPAPAILYESGHWRFVTNGISYGNKAMYQNNGAWYARNGYVCLVLDTVLAGEIPGIHTGTRDHKLWWWNSRGYTPAGVEAWFGIRALDYLSTRPEVDTNRFGITGHSGGGAYSWMVTALDDRIKAAAPLAGMADARSHALDPIMDSHCDCNFFINYYHWDFPQVAALAAPRPLLLGGTDNDRLFNLPNTLRIHEKVRKIYELGKAQNNFGFVIAPGIHDEVPELQLAVMRWFNRHLKGEERPVETAARRMFPPTEMRVFDQLPANSINTNIAESFVPKASSKSWQADELRAALRRKPFANWPGETNLPAYTQVIRAERDGLRLSAWDFISQENVQLRLYLVETTSGPRSEKMKLTILDAPAWTNWVAAAAGHFPAELSSEKMLAVRSAGTDLLNTMKSDLRDQSLAFFAPRGIGLDVWTGDERVQSRIRRRFQLLGQTVDGMGVWDIQRAIQTLQSVRENGGTRLSVHANGAMGVNALYSALFESSVRELELTNLPESHLHGPDYLGIMTICDIPDVLATVKRSAQVDVR
jgi:Acetyl esterase (deacetylase)